MMDTLIDDCDYEISSIDSLIEEQLGEFTMSSDLYATSPDLSYTSDVGDDLDRIGSSDDIYANCRKIVLMQRLEVAYALLSRTF